MLLQLYFPQPALETPIGGVTAIFVIQIKIKILK